LPHLVGVTLVKKSVHVHVRPNGQSYTFCSIVAECLPHHPKVKAGNTKGGSITVPLTSCLTSLDYSVLQIKIKIVGCYTADSKPVNRRSMVQ
jgi:hypothetical protein